jgi:hypothetical protein
MPTVNALATGLLLEAGEATDDPGLVTLTEGFVISALDEIAIATNWNSFKTRSTFNTEIDEDRYRLPAGGREIIQLRYTDNGQPIRLLTVQEAARRSYKLEDPGRACEWLEDGTFVDTDAGTVLYQFRLAPVPNAVLEIEVEYYYHPSGVVSASTLPVQDQFLTAVKDRTRGYLLERQNKYQAATLRQRSFEKNLATLVKQETRKVAAETMMKNTIIPRNRIGRPIFDPGHYRN